MRRMAVLFLALAAEWTSEAQNTPFRPAIVDGTVQLVNGLTRQISEMWGQNKNRDIITYWKSADEVARVCIPTCNNVASENASHFSVTNLLRIEWMKASPQETAVMLKGLPSEKYLPVKGKISFRDGTSVVGFIVDLWGTGFEGKSVFLADETIKSITIGKASPPK